MMWRSRAVCRRSEQWNPVMTPYVSILHPTTASRGEHQNSENKDRGSSSCRAHTNIFFLKTHKTASSTIMNILFRYGEFHNLTFALPSKTNSQFFYPKYFTAAFVDGFSAHNNNTYQIMCHHMRFLLTEVEKVMPSNSFYFTILRNPVSLMESSFSYYKATSSFIRAKSLEDFLNKTSNYYKGNSHARNIMTFDLGFDHNGKESPKHFQLAGRMVEATYDLVLITEYFDESLVLLKDALCWTFDDVLSFPLNTRTNSTKLAMSQDTQEKIKIWNQLDWQLYVYFNNSFWDRVEKFGKERMQREVEELRKRRAQVAKLCLKDTVEVNKIQDKFLIPYQSGKAKILGYNLNPGLGKAEQLLCQRMVTPELQYTNLLRAKQRKSKFSSINSMIIQVRRQK
ncbi:galactose-3-O-sulfotransferase 2 isoform X2 [Xenopus laevis]|uniref:Galactose-3-O-sulfotransferase 2 isoform X2 n=1 Tax=Xenopus laevis TaxID=8355 RepID=A0A8J0V5V7_XENLA|nr:galactose-3-O-sulfotransferase 2 isoform X2 [Xenopus laevis]